jgi:hypothetical protein
MSESRARYGWESGFPQFRETPSGIIRERLAAFITDASEEQQRAWRDSIPPLQREVAEVLVRLQRAEAFSAILEYELPLESRRPDVVLLVSAGILVIELKGQRRPTQAALDQVAAYARDLKAYHRECHHRDVVPVLVPTLARGYIEQTQGVHVTGPDALDSLIAQLVSASAGAPPDRASFLSQDAYSPLPTLVEAARELFRSQTVRTIHRARAATEPAVEEIARIIHQAALTKSRHLILLTGVPGAGKTLVGLRTVHAKYLDDLAVARGGSKPTAPAVFLSGNGPLVEVLQYELRRAGGDGKTFVRGVKDYVKMHSGRGKRVPNEHVLVFDEAQRAFDAAMMAEKHGDGMKISEPEAFIEFAGRVPEWCVVIGLIGSGQEIHVGEEGGVAQWRSAIERAPHRDWTVHLPPHLESVFASHTLPRFAKPQLNLDVELRFHAAQDLHRWVGGLLDGQDPETLVHLANQLERDGFHLRMSRDLDVAKEYLRQRYAEDPSARYGLVASSKDKALEQFGVPNGFQATKRVKLGPWYGDGEAEPGQLSCRHMTTCVTEFGAQGLELDAALLAWGTDLRWLSGAWSNVDARGYKKKAMVRDALALRRNAYRVLLTRGRDGCVLFVPPLYDLNATFDRLVAAGVRVLRED